MEGDVIGRDHSVAMETNRTERIGKLSFNSSRTQFINNSDINYLHGNGYHLTQLDFITTLNAELNM